MNIAVALLLEDEERVWRRRIFQTLKVKRKVLRDMSNPFDMDPHYFRKFYRLSPNLVMELIDLLEPGIRAQGASTIPLHLQVLASLRFFAEGSYQKGVGQDFVHPISQPTFSRCLRRVVIAICQLSHDWISFPTTAQERQEISNAFLQTIRIPGIVGLVDCFVVKFVRPSNNEEAFYHHKHLHSMNVQVVCDDKFFIRSLRICPGSNNDRHIWNFSDVRNHMLQLRANDDIVRDEGHYYILGDSGYTPSPVLLTPIRHADEGTPEFIYTQEHVRTRSKVERTFGILTNMWLAISRRRVLHYKPPKVALIIQACAVLHNFRLMHGEQDYNDEQIFLEIVDAFQHNNCANGIEERNYLLQRYYA